MKSYTNKYGITFSGVIVFTHLESIDDPASWEDINLDRNEDSSKKDKK
jgi:hypothetical protein